uniref:Uncharacterized protein n=1 Tax=Arundo donax TaxID=35708 RepID=A0A0A9G9U9_ARUDO
MGSHSHRPTPPPLSSRRRHLFSPLLDEGCGGGVAAALVVFVLVLSPAGSAAASRSPSPVDDASPLPEAPAPSPSRSTFARAAGGQRRTRRWTSASPRPRGGTEDIRIDGAPPPAAAGRRGSGRRSERDGDAMGSEARVSAAAEAIRRGVERRRAPNP